jgi:hypothetical protein
MAIFRSYATANGTSPSISVSLPSGTVAGDLLIALCNTITNSASYASMTPPAGWSTLLNVQTANGGHTLNSYVFYKVAGGSEPGSYTFLSDNVGYIILSRVSGVDASAIDTFVFDSYNSNTSSATANPFTVPTFTASTSNELVLLLPSQNATGADFSPSTVGLSYTEQVSINTIAGRVFTASLTTPGVYPTSTITPTSTLAFQANTGILIVLRSDRVTATPLTLMATIPTTAFVRLIAPSPLALTISLGAAVASAAARTWTNLQKSAAAAFTNLTKL